ncbi:hypothetical protein [Terasakiella sp. SH-1]|uniref:hypothetical protein n=1 Tax=Terasakiella sp. SH-1 TaxID=2560057 RepID=UPI00107322CE|nr:hypothetical protein [Terasakiella sp. SH-1]
MTPEISEFSYGFSLTHECIADIGDLNAAPIFPSLIEEGRSGGGYDVKLDSPGILLFLQFKRSDCLTRRSAKEIKDHNINFKLPFYRFKITERRRSRQHDLLLGLDQGPNAVFYAAPKFHLPNELNDAWKNGNMIDKSFFIRPRDIGVLDDGFHHVSFDERIHRVFSEPKEVRGYHGDEFRKTLTTQLDQISIPLDSGIVEEALILAKQAEQFADELEEEREALREEESLKLEGPQEIARALISPQQEIETEAPIQYPARRLPEPRPAKSRTEENLRTLADIALKNLGAQLYVIQK